MSKQKILVLIGGISADSINKKLFSFVAAEGGDSFDFDVFDISKLPFFSQDLEENFPAAAADLKSRVEACDGVLVVTPEYNRSFPGVIKNALDWASRPWGKNSWDGKPAGIMGASIGAIGTFGSQNHLRQVLTFLNMPTMPQPEFYFTLPNHVGDDGKLSDKAKGYVKSYLKSFEAWVAKHR